MLKPFKIKFDDEKATVSLKFKGGLRPRSLGQDNG
jgi:hypothetical protein